MYYTHMYIHTQCAYIVYIHSSNSGTHTHTVVVYSTYTYMYTYRVVMYSTYTYIHNSSIHTLLHTFTHSSRYILLLLDR